MKRRSRKAWGTASLSVIAMTLALVSSVGWAGLANCLEPSEVQVAVETTTQGIPTATESATQDVTNDDTQPVGGSAPAKGFSWKKLLPGSPW